MEEDDKKNKYGLKRRIPPHVRREVRQRDGFGCVICGEVLVDYDHVDPEFKDAKAHEAKGIALLCIHHHGMKTRKFLTKAAVKAAMSSPYAIRHSQATSMLQIFTEQPSVLIGRTETRGTVILQHNGRNVIWFREDEGRWLLNVMLFDSRSGIGLHIEDNEIRVNHENAWDFQASGGSYFIHSSIRSEVIRIAIDSDHGFVIPSLKMMVGETPVRVKSGSLFIGKLRLTDCGLLARGGCAIAFND